MYVGLFKPADNAPAKFDIKNPAQAIMLTVAFKGKLLANDILIAESDNRVLRDLYDALNGTINLTYNDKVAKPVVMISNRNMFDAVEAHAAGMMGIIHIEHVRDNTTDADNKHSDYLAYLWLTLSADGTLRLGDAMVTLQFSRFDNPVVTGCTTQKIDAQIQLDTMATPDVARSVLVMENTPIANGANTTFDIAARPVVLLPVYALEQLQLNASGGILLDVSADTKEVFTRKVSMPHCNTFGLIQHYYRYVGIPASGFVNGSIQTDGDTDVYFLYNRAIS